MLPQTKTENFVSHCRLATTFWMCKDSSPRATSERNRNGSRLLLIRLSMSICISIPGFDHAPELTAWTELGFFAFAACCVSVRLHVALSALAAMPPAPDVVVEASAALAAFSAPVYWLIASTAYLYEMPTLFA